MNHTLSSAPHIPQQQLDAFVDAELSSTEILASEQHLAECHACTLRVLAAMQWKAATSVAARDFSAPPEALARLAAQLRQQTPKRPARVYAFPLRLRWPQWTALAAACLLLVLSPLVWRQTHPADTLAAELLDQHLAVLSATSAPQVISTDRHTVKPWFQGKLPFSFNIPEVLPPDTALKGGDLTYVNGQPAALLLFTIGKHQVSVFLLQRDHRGVAPSLAVARSGFLIHDTTTPELHIVAVSDINPTQLDLLVEALKRVQ